MQDQHETEEALSTHENQKERRIVAFCSDISFIMTIAATYEIKGDQSFFFPDMSKVIRVVYRDVLYPMLSTYANCQRMCYIPEEYVQGYSRASLHIWF